MLKLVDRIEVLSPAVTLTRARACTRIQIEYALGAGGRNPRSSDPRSEKLRNGIRRFGLDCSGLVAHAIGFDRYQPNFIPWGGWVNTDSLIEDALGLRQLVEQVMYPEVGALLCFPGVDYDSDGDRDRIGHVAIVSSIARVAEWDPNAPQYHLVDIIDCAGSNSKLPGAVGDVAEHDARYFNGKATFRSRTSPRWATKILRVRYENLD